MMLNDVGETVPWVTVCETKKKSNLSLKVTVLSIMVPGFGLSFELFKKNRLLIRLETITYAMPGLYC